MKRIAVWAFYGVGALAVGYLALYGYAVFTGRDLQPGDPIHISRRPDAPSYSLREKNPDTGSLAIANPSQRTVDSRRRRPA